MITVKESEKLLELIEKCLDSAIYYDRLLGSDSLILNEKKQAHRENLDEIKQYIRSLTFTSQIVE